MLFSVAALLGALMPLVFDSALKGAVLLAVATLGALLLFRASAATRHLVWLVAVVALLVVPVLSLALPQWRVLPRWAVVGALPAPSGEVQDRAVESDQTHESGTVVVPPLPPTIPANLPPSAEPPLPAFSAPRVTPDPPRTWREWLAPAWAVGFVILALRLLAAHLLLRRAMRGCVVVAVTPDSSETDGLAAQFHAACAHLGSRQNVTLLLDARRTIPVVWGVFRPRLLLPAESLEWSGEQVRSVLLHELAHLKRRDPLVQWLTQIACALHWFNPLVWLAAWRLHAERERACDDLVLASGVRPSAYAEHLLHVATKLSPARWTAACGLAMARKSSLEGRLLAVLSEKLNRRSVTSALAAIALILGAGIAIPVAMLRAADEKWNPHQVAHIGTNDFSAYCVHGGKDASFVIAYHGDFGSATESVTNPKKRTWTDSGTITAKKPGIALSFHRTHNAPGKLSITTAPAEGRDLSQPAPPPRKFGQREYDLTKGRVFLLSDSGDVRQLDIATPDVTDHESAKKLAALIAAVPPQETKQVAASDQKAIPTLTPETEAQLDWGAAVNGLRAAVVIRTPNPGAAMGIYLAVQNVSVAALRFSDSMAAKEQRKLYLSDSAGILAAITSSEPTKTDTVLPPREILFLHMFPTNLEKEGEAALIEGIRKDSLQTWRAVLDIQKAPDGAWKGKLTSGETRCTVAEGPQPKSEEGRALFKFWQNTARLNGDIPGGLLARLHDKVKEFIRFNSGDASGDTYAKKMAPLEPRFGPAGDWKPADVVALMDDIAAVTTIPLETTLNHLTQNTLRHGQPLPTALEKADWGQPLESGLRMAYLLEPRAAEYSLGTEVKARILLHNSGKEHVAFIAGSFHQPSHKAKRADGSEIKLDATDWLTRSVPQAYRLAPGEYIELNAPGLGIGEHNKDRDDWSEVRAGSRILCGDGEEVTFLPGGIMLTSQESPADPDWWSSFIAERLNREAPVPLDTKEREYLLYRVVRDLFGTAPSTTEGDAFAADKSPDALKNLAALLTKHIYGKRSQGMIQPSETKFRVLPRDPDAAKKPRVAMNPGHYKLADEVRLVVTRRQQGARIINEGSVTYFQPGKDNIPHDLKLSDGYDTWAAGWEPGTTILWVSQKGLLRSFNFTDPAAVKVTRYEGDQTTTAPIPADLRAAIGTVLTAPDAPKQIREAQPPASIAPAAELPKPAHKDARAIYEIWLRHSRANGDIPGALIGELAAAVKVFIGYNPTWETVPKLNALLPRLDATHDWKAADAIALLDEVAAIKDSPLSMAMRRGTRHTIRNGEALPEKFAGVAWGEAQPKGLRAAWVLEPGAAEHRIGAALKARLLVWNPGAVPVMLQVPTWHQGGVKATDAKGAEVQASGLEWTTMAQLLPVRLGPGEYIEINTPGIGFGPRAGMGPWAGPRVGSNVLAKAGDELTLTHGLVPLDGSEVGVSEDDPHVVGPGWWLAHIKARMSKELPLPADAAERTRLLDRAVRDLFATAPTAEETAAFVADKTPDALDALIKRLAAREDVVSFSGKLPTAPAKFRVLAADANADKQPRVALGPGEYPVGHGAWKLKIVGKQVGDRSTNDAQIWFVTDESAGIPRAFSHKLNIPDGWGTWAIVCRPGEQFLYLLHKGGARKIDFSNPAKVTDTPATDLPAQFRDEVKRQLEAAGVSAESQAEVFEKPAPPAKTPEPKTGAVSPEPKNEYALAHFRHLQKYARENGDIPGGLIALLDRSLGVGLVTTLDALVKRLDATRDWTAKETAEFLDAAAATKDWTGDDGRLLALENYDIAQHGKPLPPELASLPWGKADDGLHPALEATGLRAAFTLEPAAASYAQGSQLPVTVHYHNSGTAPLVFPVGFRSMDLAEALDGQGRDILTALTFPNGDNGQMKDGPSKPKYSVRLEPGHWISVQGARLTIAAGRHTDTPDSHGIVMMAPTDATVKLKWSPMTATSNEGPGKKPIEWKVRVATCIERVSPMPKSRADRKSLIRRVTLNLTGEDASDADVAAFVADDSPDALAKLTARFQSLPPLARYAGWLKAGEQTFKVTSAPADYRGTVMTANGSGLYEVTDSVFLQHYGKHANLVFMPPAPVRHPHTIHVKDKEDRRVPHGIVWRHGSGVVWVAEKTRVRKFDFTTPGKLTETELPAGIASIPEELRAELVKAFPAVVAAVTEAPATTPVPKTGQADKPQLPQLPDDAYARPGFQGQKFREEDAKRPGGERMGAVLEPSKPADRDKEPLVLGVRTASDAQWRIGGTAKVGLVVRNRSDSDVKFSYTFRLDNRLSVVVVDEAGKEHPAAVAHFDGLLTYQQMLLPAGHVATIAEFTLRFDPEKRVVSEPHVSAFHLPPGKYKLRCKWNDALPEVAHEGEWTGELVNEELEFTLAAAAAPAAETPKAGSHAASPSPQKPKTERPKEADAKTASAEGDYDLGGRARLNIERPAGPDGKPVSNPIAILSFDSAALPGSTIETDFNPHFIELGEAPFRFVWEHGTSVVWLVRQKTITKIDFTNRQKVKDETIAPERVNDLPEAVKEARVFVGEPSRKVDWSKCTASADLNAPFDPAEALRLAAAPEKTDKDFRRLMYLILKGAAEKAPELRPLLTNKALKRDSREFPGLAPVLAAYDYSVNGNKTALKSLLAELAKEPVGSDCWSAAALGFIDEWDLSIAAFEKHYSGNNDGARGECIYMFWATREHVFPESFARFQAKRQAAVKLTPDGLLGFWRGKMDGKDLTLSFHRPPVEKDVQLDIYEGEATIGSLAKFTIAGDGGSAIVGSGRKGSAPFGTLRPGKAGTLKLELHNPQKGQKEVVLTHDADPPATEPQQAEARELFEMWKTTANEDGTIPGTFIGQLATEVRAYVKAHPNLDSGMKLPKLLPRFVTTRDWTQAEAIKLLDDVAHYATEPIAARVAKAKLPSGPLWRTMVEFQDIPVAIAKWSEAKDGLRIGMRVVAGEWRLGGKVRVELWLHNAGEKDVTFKTSGPTKSDVGVWVTAVGADGTEHHTENGNLRIPFVFLDGALPAGHVAMAKTIEVTFSEPSNEEKGRMFETRFPELEPGKYKLRCLWTDPSPNVSTAGDWTGTLAAPEVEFTLAPKTAKAAPVPDDAKLPKDDAPSAATEPRQKEPRELFEMWKLTANQHGTIPGTFIGMLATEVRAFVKANPNLDSGMKLPKLLPRFATARDWTQAEAIKLLDDVAYYATEPIAARVAKSKLPSGPLWRSMVEFQDIPVAIAKWSEAKDGLRIGMRVVEGEWRVGGEVNVEMWLHNAGTKDLTLKANPQRSDVGVWVVAKDSEGQDHGAANGNILILAIPQTCVLPAGHVAKIKSFALTFDAPGNKQQGWMQPRFRELQPGSYKLRCEWSDAERQTGYGPDFSTDKFWKGKLTTPELDFTLVANAAPAAASEAPKAEKPKPETPKGADAAAPFREKLAELDTKITALKMQRERLSQRFATKHPNIRKLDAEVEALEEARASFVATNPQALSPKPPVATQPLLPQPPANNPASVAQPLPEFVFARRDWSRLAKVAVGDGVTVAIHEEVINRADIMATARIRYTAADGAVKGHDMFIASDVSGSRAKWAYGWVRGMKTFWFCSVSPDNSYSLHRVSFADPQRITDDYQQYYPGEEPQRTLGVPDAFYSQLVDVLGFQKWTVLDKSNGLPEISGQHVTAAQPLTPAGVPVKAATTLPLSKDKRWKVQFVDAVTGQPVSRLRATVTSRTADGSRTTIVTKVVSDGAFERNLNSDEHAWVSVVDEAWTNADDAVRLFGNVPADAKATEKHTNPDAPFIVKVKPRVKTANAPAASERKLPPVDGPPVNARLADDRYAKSGVPLAEQTWPMPPWGAEKEGLSTGLRSSEDWLLNTLDGAIFEFAFDPNLERTSNGVSLQPTAPPQTDANSPKPK